MVVGVCECVRVRVCVIACVRISVGDCVRVGVVVVGFCGYWCVCWRIGLFWCCWCVCVRMDACVSVCMCQV